MGEASHVLHLFAKVGNHNIRHLSAALHLLQKVGKELIIETENGTLTFRSLNDSKSAFTSVEFDKDFFEKFSTASGGVSFSCKVAIKPVCSILRNLKITESMIIRAQYSAKFEHELVFEMVGMSGVTRTHRFNYSDCEIMSAIFDEESASHIRCEPKVFTQLLEHFYHSPEISIDASRSLFQVKSFHQEQANDSSSASGRGRSAMKHMTTGLAVNIGEFDQYDFVGSNVTDQIEDENRFEELVVCSKELRAMLNYCEAAETPFFSFFFTSGGRPVKLTAGGDRDRGGGHVKVDLVLATLSIRQPGGNASRSQQDHSPHQSQGQSQDPRMQGQSEQYSMTKVSQRSAGAMVASDVRDGEPSRGQFDDHCREELEVSASVQDVSAVLAGLTDDYRRMQHSGIDHQADADIHNDGDSDEEEDLMGSERSSAQQPMSSSNTSTPRQAPMQRPIRRKPKRMLDSSSEEEGEGE